MVPFQIHLPLMNFSGQRVRRLYSNIVEGGHRGAGSQNGGPCLVHVLHTTVLGLLTCTNPTGLVSRTHDSSWSGSRLPSKSSVHRVETPNFIWSLPEVGCLRCSRLNLLPITRNFSLFRPYQTLSCFEPAWGKASTKFLVP